MRLAAFMATPLGRVIRVLVGIALIVVGLAVTGGAAGGIMAAIGTALIAFGVFNVCVIALLLGAPFDGRKVRQRQERPSLQERSAD
jgi:hypothetical protein